MITNTTYTALNQEGQEISYQDRKRRWWFISMMFPITLSMVGLTLFSVTRAEWTLVVPLIIAYGVIPLLDWLIGEDLNNPPEEVVPQLESDRYYATVSHLTVPLHVITLCVTAWFVSTSDLSLFGFVCAAIVCGLTNGFAINTAHELGHKYGDPLSQNLAKLALAVPFYGHFTVEHNRGHHRWVATPEDPASSRLGESIYRFALRELPQTFVRGLELERERLERRRVSFWSAQNQVLQSYALSVILQGTLIGCFGWMMVPFLVIHNVFAWFQLTSANYIEHYGLLRDQRPHNGEVDGGVDEGSNRRSRARYEPCKPHHSWNSNHSLSNLTLFNLERHSDHHANPTRSYQSLRDFPDIPRLPNGYFGMYLLAYIPPLWFRVMDQRVLDLPHIQGDIAKVNLDPKHAQAYRDRYARPSSPA